MPVTEASRTKRAAKRFPARDFARAKRLIGEAGYNGEKIVVLDAADILQLHSEALVTDDLLHRRPNGGRSSGGFRRASRSSAAAGV